MKPRPTRALAAVTAAVLSLLLAACAGVPLSVATNTYPSVPPGYAKTVNLISAEPIAVWVHGDTILGVITVSSELCPPVPTAISASDATTIALTFVKSPNSPCSSSIAPTTHEFKIPEGIDVTAEVTVNIHFDFDGGQDYAVVVRG